ncbi:MAG: hypothetical protein JO091_15070 [Acidobacteriaceae bacterium]|nr:hypothetical protein [Acidobacteriaceae bacterium]
MSRIVTEHQGRVRVEDNYPTGTRFLIELNALTPESSVVESLRAAPATLKV